MPSDSLQAAISPRVQEKRRRRREEILHAAFRAFRDTGYHATTLDDIASQLGIRKTALYHPRPRFQRLRTRSSICFVATSTVRMKSSSRQRERSSELKGSPCWHIACSRMPIPKGDASGVLDRRLELSAGSGF